MKKLTSFFKSKLGKVLLIVVSIIIVFTVARSAARETELKRIEKVVTDSDNFGSGIPEDMTVRRIAEWIYDNNKKTGKYDGKWWA